MLSGIKSKQVKEVEKTALNQWGFTEARGQAKAVAFLTEGVVSVPMFAMKDVIKRSPPPLYCAVTKKKKPCFFSLFLSHTNMNQE